MWLDHIQADKKIALWKSLKIQMEKKWTIGYECKNRAGEKAKRENTFAVVNLNYAAVLFEDVRDIQNAKLSFATIKRLSSRFSTSKQTYIYCQNATNIEYAHYEAMIPTSDIIYTNWRVHSSNEHLSLPEK